MMSNIPRFAIFLIASLAVGACDKTKNIPIPDGMDDATTEEDGSPTTGGDTQLNCTTTEVERSELPTSIDV